jgi:hypothetical protein
MRRAKLLTQKSLVGGILARLISRLVVPLILAMTAGCLCWIMFGDELREPPESEAPLVNLGEVSVGIAAHVESKVIPQARVFPVRVEVPLAQVPYGCEFLYGAAVYQYHHSNERLIEMPRYLIKFRYDLRAGRCVSEDLSLVDREGPVTVLLQLVDVQLGATEYVEIPRPQGIEITAASPGQPAFALISIEPREPFRLPRVTQLNPKFSHDLSPQQRELFVAPYDDIKGVILEELARATDLCRSGSACPSVRGAIAELLDPDISQALDEARRAGVSVDVVTNYRAQSESSRLITLEQGELRSITSRYAGPSPWMWLRGNPHRLVLKLPMHTKFLAVGDSFVVSTNANFNFVFTASSREISMVYRSPEIVRMFDEVLTQVRTSVYRPLAVNLEDPFILLFNADRGRGYSVTQRKPFVPIETNEGVRSDAYGILLEILSRVEGPVRLAMSPISNGCGTYRRRRCLFELLRDLVTEERLELFMNGYFYLIDNAGAPDEWRYAHADYREFVSERFKPIQALFGVNHPTQPQLFMQKGNSYSLHHERAGLLGQDLVLAGSTNLGQTGTLNVMELIRDPELFRGLRGEFDTFDEPYFVSPVHPWTPNNKRRGNCEFTFERDLLRRSDYRRKRFRRSELRAELQRRHGIDPSVPIEIIEPLQTPAADDGVRYISDVELSTTPVEETFISWSSYLCVKVGARDEVAVRVREAQAD